MITGSVGDTMLIDYLQVNPPSGNNSALAIQFSTDGHATWADCISGNGRNFSNGTVIDRKGNLYLAGSFQGTFEKVTDALTSLGDQDIRFQDRQLLHQVSFTAGVVNGPICLAFIGIHHRALGDIDMRKIWGDVFYCPSTVAL